MSALADLHERTMMSLDSPTQSAPQTPMPDSHRRPSIAMAAIPVVTLIVLLGGGYIFAELPVEPLLIASAVVAGLVA